MLQLDSPATWPKEMLSGVFDSFIYSTLVKLPTIEGYVVWDVGAHIGYHSLCFSALIGKTGRVLAFEPNFHNIRRSRVNIISNPNLSERISLYSYALTDVDGYAVLSFSPDIDSGNSSGSHLLETNPPEDTAAYTTFHNTTVPVFKIDTLIAEKGFSIPQIIKIDTEGSEFSILNGGLNLFNNHHPLLFIEIHSANSMFYIDELLSSLGYKIRILNKDKNNISRCHIFAYSILGKTKN